MIYLASPYTHPEEVVRNVRFTAACRHAAAMMREGDLVLSPIAHSHCLAKHGGLPTSWEYWREFDTQLMKNVDELHVLKLPGWETSEGIRNEINLALSLGLPVAYRNP